MTTEGERLELLLNVMKINALRLSKDSGVSQPQISGAINGKSKISNEMLRRICTAYPQVNAHWLLMGTGEMFLPVGVSVPSETIAAEDAPPYTPTKTEYNPEIPNEDVIKELVSRNLRTAAERWKISQVQLAKKLGADVSRAGAAGYFTAKNLPRLPVLLQFEVLTGIPLSVLLTTQVPESAFPDQPQNNGMVSTAATDVRNLQTHLQRALKAISNLIQEVENKNIAKKGGESDSAKV